MPERLKAIGTEVHRCFDEVSGQAAEAGNGVIIDNNDAERGVTENDCPHRKIEPHDVERKTDDLLENAPDIDSKTQQFKVKRVL